MHIVCVCVSLVKICFRPPRNISGYGVWSPTRSTSWWRAHMYYVHTRLWVPRLHAVPRSAGRVRDWRPNQTERACLLRKTVYTRVPTHGVKYNINRSRVYYNMRNVSQRSDVWNNINCSIQYLYFINFFFSMNIKTLRYSKNVLRFFFFFLNPKFEFFTWVINKINKNKNDHFVDQISRKNVGDKRFFKSNVIIV